MTTSSRCPICDSAQVWYFRSVKEHTIYECADCNFIFSAITGAATTPPDGAKAIISAGNLRQLAKYSKDSAGEILFVDDYSGNTIPNKPLRSVCAAANSLLFSPDPIRFLNSLHSILINNGTLYLKIPLIISKNDVDNHSLRANYFDCITIQNALAKSHFHEIYIFKDKDLAHFNIFCKAKAPAERPKVSIILPVYNEAGTFPELMDRLIAQKLNDIDKEIIVIESNSTDGTKEMAQKYAGHAGVKVVFEEKPRGKGHAVRNGLSHASGDFIMIQDGDLEYDINDYDMLLYKLIRYQEAFVLGSRHGNGWKMRNYTTQRSIAFIMNFGQLFFTLLINLFCGSHMKDPFTMFKVFRRDCLFGLTLKSNRFDLDWELVIKFLRKGYVPCELPVNYSSRSFHEGKKINCFTDPFSWLKALIKYRFEPLYSQRYEILS